MPLPRFSTRRRVSRAAVLGAVLGVFAAAAVPAPPAVAQPVCGPPGDPAPTDRPWALRRLEPGTVWPLTRGQDVVVAVIDSGVSNLHPTLAGKVLPGRDFSGLPDHSGRCDLHGHGTVVAGIIAGRDSSGVPFSGIAPEAAILPARVLPDRRPSTDVDLPNQVAAAIRWAVDSGAEVINLSLETRSAPELAGAVAYAWDRDVVLVAAAGNIADRDQQPTPAYPAAYQQVIAVAGVDEAGGHVDTSITGDYVAVAAPGAELVGPAPGGDGYVALPEGGTSFAAAYVSGVAALVRSYHPDLPAPEVVRRITVTADSPPEGHTDQLGYGVVNPYRAVTTVLGSRPNPLAGAVAPAPVEPDPLAREKVVAAWAALGAGVLAGLVLLARPVVRLGQRRGWRPGSG